MACVTAESLARLFIDVGLVFVSASCVFSSFNSCEELPWLITTRGKRDLDGGIESAASAGATLSGAAGELAGAVPEAARIALSSFSVSPAEFKRISSFGEVLNLAGPA